MRRSILPPALLSQIKKKKGSVAMNELMGKMNELMGNSYGDRVPILLKQLFGITKLVLLALSMSYNCFATDKLNAQNAAFFSARSEIGGSVLEPLVTKCNALSDSDITADGKNVKEAIMKRLAGSIGPVDYRKTIRTKTTTSYGSVGRFQGTTSFGTQVSGDIMGTTSSTRTKVGAYKANVPAGFLKGFEKLQHLARRSKHARACAEVGACIFVEAVKGQIGMDDRAALKYFKSAAESGDIYGMFMYAFCLYYGIGNTMAKADVRKAYEVLLNMQDKMSSNVAPSGTADKVILNGWVARRLREANTMK